MPRSHQSRWQLPEHSSVHFERDEELPRAQRELTPTSTQTSTHIPQPTRTLILEDKKRKQRTEAEAATDGARKKNSLTGGEARTRNAWDLGPGRPLLIFLCCVCTLLL